VQRILVPLFTFVWWNRLYFDHPFSDNEYRRNVIKVTGWNSAIVDEITQRFHITFEIGRVKKNE
jgi:hypothetical protein